MKSAVSEFTAPAEVEEKIFVSRCAKGRLGKGGWLRVHGLQVHKRKLPWQAFMAWGLRAALRGKEAAELCVLYGCRRGLGEWFPMNDSTRNLVSYDIGLLAVRHIRRSLCGM